MTLHKTGPNLILQLKTEQYQLFYCQELWVDLSIYTIRSLDHDTLEINVDTIISIVNHKHFN